MKKYKIVIGSSLAIAMCSLTVQVKAEDAINHVSNCVDAQNNEIAIEEKEQSDDIEAPEAEGGVVEPEFECEGEYADVALGESVNEADRLFYLALAYEDGDHGFNQDYANAMRLYRKAAEMGSVVAMANIGRMYRYGIGVATNNARAVLWLKKAAEAGDPLGIHQLALSEVFGNGTERDLIVAKYRLLSNAGYAPSAESLRLIVKDQDITSGFSLAVEEHDDRIAALECAKRYGNEKYVEFDLCKAARYYGAYFYGKDYIASTRPLAHRDENGLSKSELDELMNAGPDTNINAAVELARAYANPCYRMQDLAFSEIIYYHALNEIGVPDGTLRKELEEEYAALRSEMIDVVYIRDRAINGDVDSMVDLGRRYLEGKGVSYNYQESIAWFKDAINALNAAKQRAPEPSFSERVGRFLKNNWNDFVVFAIAGFIGCLLFWLLGVLTTKISDWWKIRKAKHTNGATDEYGVSDSESVGADLDLPDIAERDHTINGEEVE